MNDVFSSIFNNQMQITKLECERYAILFENISKPVRIMIIASNDEHNNNNIGTLTNGIRFTFHVTAASK